MTRYFSIALRSWQEHRKSRKLLADFSRQKALIQELPVAAHASKKLLLIRLDDIGDYLLFRNFLPAYYQFAKQQGYTLTYLGNSATESIFNLLDAANADETIWVNKTQYNSSEDYRMHLWEQLRAAGFSRVINPSRTRPLLLDDLCALAAAASENTGAANSFKTKQLNEVSDRQYQHLFSNPEHLHEFAYNKAFASWCTGTAMPVNRPVITAAPSEAPLKQPYVLCCIGAAHKSRRLPLAQWIAFIRQVKASGLALPVLCGSNAETEAAATIAAATGAQNITGATTLPEILNWMQHAAVAVCNDSMAAHLAVSCSTAAIIVSNGNNYPRFTTYAEAGIPNVVTIYARPFLKTLQAREQKVFWHYTPVTKDMNTIDSTAIFDRVHSLLARQSI
ncbi:MAG: glycosyltransferase family 9 protein [Niabella sp.]|nr:glycosyltransferase family 9 protein [Niabella sp.]